MYDLERLQKEFKQLAQATNVPDDLPIIINGRLTRTLGQFKTAYDYNGQRYVSQCIEISKNLLETATDASIEDILKHETAHYIAFVRTGVSHGHDSVFKEICAEINCKNDGYAAIVERAVENYSKYTVYCRNCDKVVGRFNRRTRIINNLANCRCSICNGSKLELITR